MNISKISKPLLDRKNESLCTDYVIDDQISQISNVAKVPAFKRRTVSYAGVPNKFHSMKTSPKAVFSAMHSKKLSLTNFSDQ